MTNCSKGGEAKPRGARRFRSALRRRRVRRRPRMPRHAGHGDDEEAHDTDPCRTSTRTLGRRAAPRSNRPTTTPSSTWRPRARTPEGVRDPPGRRPSRPAARGLRPASFRGSGTRGRPRPAPPTAERLEGEGQRGDAREAIVAVLRQAALDDRLDRHGNVGADAAQRRRHLLRDRQQELHEVRARERELPQSSQRHPDGPHVGARVDRLGVACLLGGHVHGGFRGALATPSRGRPRAPQAAAPSRCRSRAPSPRATRPGGGPGKDCSACAPGEPSRARAPARPPRGPRGRSRPSRRPAMDPSRCARLEILPLEVLEHHVRAAVVERPDVHHGRHVLSTDTRRRARLVEEPRRGPRRARHMRHEDLHRDELVEDFMVRGVHLGDPAPPDEPLDPVLTRQHLAGLQHGVRQIQHWDPTMMHLWLRMSCARPRLG